MKDLLGIERIGINDNFFELGGHSLKATSLASRIHKEFNVEVPLKEIFNKQRVRETGDILVMQEKTCMHQYNLGRKKYYAVSATQKRMYILNRLEESGTSYNIPGVFTTEMEKTGQGTSGECI